MLTLFNRRTDHELVQSVDESLFTTLCEDVFSLVNIQVDLLHEYLQVNKIEKTETGQNLVLVSLISIVRNLHELQLQHRDRFLQDLEFSCAAANDFMRMIECFDDLMESIHRRYPRLKLLMNQPIQNEQDYANMAILESESSDLIALYGNDAVYSVQRSQMIVIDNIQQSSIPLDLFSAAWEVDFHNNEVARAIVCQAENFLRECHDQLCNAFLYGKVVGALIRSIVCLYVKCLLQKAKRIRLHKQGDADSGSVETPFVTPSRAVLRMLHDIEVFRKYFLHLIKQMPELSRLVEDELSILVVFHECLTLASDDRDLSTPEDLIVVLHKRTGANPGVTRYIMKDLWLLAAHEPDRQRALYNTLTLLRGELRVLSINLDENVNDATSPRPRDHLPGLILKEVLEQFYDHRIHKSTFHFMSLG
jgi:hypothetical protein